MHNKVKFLTNGKLGMSTNIRFLLGNIYVCKGKYGKIVMDFTSLLTFDFST